LSIENLLRLGILVPILAASVLYGRRERRQTAALIRVISVLLVVYSFAQLLLIGFLWQNHVSFPLNLEAMELTVLQHVQRVMNGQPIYVEPTSSFVPLAYNPLFYYLALPAAWIFGTSLFSLRLVAILGMFGSGLVIFVVTRRAAGSSWWGLMAVGLFAAAYRAMDAYLDTAHADSWLLFTVLLACYLIDLDRSRIMNLVSILLMVFAFWFKQPGAIFCLGAVLFLTLREGWRKSWPYWLLALALGPILYLLPPTWLLGPRFHYYTWEVPRQWTGFDLGTVRRLGSIVVKSYFFLFVVGFVASALSLWRSLSKSRIWYFMFPVAALSGVVGALDAGSNNNVFILMGTWFIITGVIGLRDLVDRFSWVGRRGLHAFVLLACFALLVHNPLSVMVSSRAAVAYQELISYLESVDGPVYAPWIGQLQDGYSFYPAVHWVPLEDMVRGPGKDVQGHPLVQELLEPVLNPKGKAYVLHNYPLENDTMLGFLTDRYVFEADLGERFAPLSTLPRRYNLAWPRYLYRYAPEEAAAQGSREP
jgi:hypothetical protein